MKKFSVGSCVMGRDDVNVGIAPGKFDTKQLILSSIAVLTFASYQTLVRFVRTINKDELARCQLFINDDFTTMFPVIPSYHDVAKQWYKNSTAILNRYGIYDEESCKIVTESVREKICNLEAIDCLMELYSAKSTQTDSFEEALEITLTLIEKAITDSIEEISYYCTVKEYIKRTTNNYITPPLYIQGWRNIVLNTENASHVEYAVFPDEDGTLVIESLDKGIVMKKHVKGMEGISYSGRFFIKVEDIDVADLVIKKLPTKQERQDAKLA